MIYLLFFMFFVCQFNGIMYFCSTNQKIVRIMTALQMNALNAQIWRDMGTIAEDEGMMQRVAKSEKSRERNGRRPKPDD